MVLSGHTDVVPVDGQDWTCRPVRAAVRGRQALRPRRRRHEGLRRLRARAAMLAAAAALASPLHLALSYDEEVGCLGVRGPIECCSTGAPAAAALHRRRAHRDGGGDRAQGQVAAAATCRGRAGHSALAPLSVNAIHLACDLVAASARGRPRWPSAGRRDAAYDVPYTTLHAGRIEGGTALNIVPDRCDLDFEIRNLAADDPQGCLAASACGRSASDRRYREQGAGGRHRHRGHERLSGARHGARHRGGRLRQSADRRERHDQGRFGTEGGLFRERLGSRPSSAAPARWTRATRRTSSSRAAQLARCDAMLDALIGRLVAGL